MLWVNNTKKCKILILIDDLSRIDYNNYRIILLLNLGKVFTKAQSLIEKADAQDLERYMILSKDKSKWKAEHYFKVTKDVPGLEMEKLSGTFITRAFDGEFKDVPSLYQEMDDYIEESGYTMKENFVFYTTCPKCAKHYGHNYMVFFSRV